MLIINYGIKTTQNYAKMEESKATHNQTEAAYIKQKKKKKANKIKNSFIHKIVSYIYVYLFMFLF